MRCPRHSPVVSDISLKQFFTTGMLQQISDIDALNTPIKKSYCNSHGQQLFENEKAMQDFLQRPHQRGGCVAWKKETGQDWKTMYGEMEATYRSLKTPDARELRSTATTQELVELFNTIYISCLQGDLSTTSLRKGGDVVYHDAFALYVDDLITAVQDKYDLTNASPEPQTFLSQLLSKLRFLTADVRGVLAAKPLFCLSYALDSCTEWMKYPLAIREVSHSFWISAQVSYSKPAPVSNPSLDIRYTAHL